LSQTFWSEGGVEPIIALMLVFELPLFAPQG